MIKFKQLIKLLPLLLMGIIMLNSCEGELDDLGSQLVGANGADGYDKAFSLIAYNVDNNDVIRADGSKLDSVRIGAFSEPVFGGQKVSYITQLRLNKYDPDFGKNAVVDSVVLTLKPKYESATDSVTTSTNEDYIYPDGNVAAKKVVTTYPVSKYGKAKIGGQKAPLTIKVKEVTDFLGGVSDSLFSNKAVAEGTLLGSKAFNGTVNSVKITKDSDNSDLIPEISTSLRINLDKDFFQNKIIAKKGNQVLKDAASFIRYFRGISISVEENDGYLFSMAPNDAKLTIYYKNDVTATDGTVTRTSQTTDLSLGSSNVHLSQISYSRPGAYTSAMNSAVNINNINNPVTPNNYANKLYLQGMGGSGIGIKIPASTIDALRTLYKNDKIAIVSAKIRLYNDASWDNKYQKPSSLLVQESIKDTVRFLPDMTTLASAGYSLIKTANLSTVDATYDVGVTATIKNIVEHNYASHDLIINVGSYLRSSSTGALLGQKYNTRAYNPYRVVLQGMTDTSKFGEEVDVKTYKGAQLLLIYTKKNK
jgi:hypothetical protein